MRPSILKINGLNSFNQTEAIDFSELTSRGLFGIFGPTGSGKSTILDAITLVLYGEVARNTKSYINSELDKAYIYFEFFSGHGINKKKYILERTIKRTKTGISTPKVKLETYDRFDNLEEVIEKRTAVESELKENIIKLNFEDFIRTVVLPQGKFSEFLTLTGAERNHMLERILGLEEYGRVLTEKINAKKQETNDKLNYLNGELNRYSDLSAEDVKELETRQKEILREEEDLKKEVKLLEERYKKYSEIYSLQEELNKYKDNYEKILKNKNNIDIDEVRIRNARDALHIIPYVETLEGNIKEEKENSEKLRILETSLIELEKEIEKVDNDYKNSYEIREKEYPILIEKKTRLDRAIELEEETKKSKELLESEEKQANELKQNLENLKIKINDSKTKQAKLSSDIESTEAEVKKKVISSAYRNKLVEGIDIEKKYEESIGDLKSKEEEYKKTKERIVNGKTEINKLDALLLKIEEELDKYKDDYIFLSKTLIKKEKDLKQIKEDIDDLKEKSLAKLLAKNLKEDSPCPVCGSTSHPNIISGNLGDLEKMEKERDHLETSINGLKSDLNVIKSIAYFANWEISDSDLEGEVKEVSNLKEMLESLKVNLENARDQKTDINEKKIKYKSHLESIEENLETIISEKEKIYNMQEELSKKYNKIKDDLKVENISKKYEEVKLVEEELEKLNEKLINDRSKLKKIEEIRQELDSKLNTSNLKLEGLNSSIKINRENIEKNTVEIKSIVGEESPIDLKEKIEKRIQELTQKEKTLREKLENLKDKNDEFKNQHLVIEKSNKMLKTNIENTKEKLTYLLNEYKFENIEEVKNSYIDKDEIIEKEKYIEEYKKSKQELEANINRVKKLLDGQSITLEELKTMDKEKEEKYNAQTKLLEEKGKISEQLNEINKNMIRLKELSSEIEKLENRKDSLDEIYKITKGKKFVEFVSRNHLDYIARVATKQLKSITRDRYGLVLNDENAFEIVDNHNGGITRDCSSLSGGETFLTSLSLALALSTKIQLKGDTSIEFFFLDEGFGTLDVETLDTAMTALENLYTENLSVGIISHVEEIKNRVPIKLMVEPPVPGISGSKVRITRT